MRQNMSKKIAAMGIAGLTGFALLSSSLGNNVLVADAKTNETVTVSERQDKVKPVTCSAVDEKDKVKPVTCPVVDGKDKIKPATCSAIDGKDKVKPTDDSSLETTKKGSKKKGSASTKKVKVKKTKKTAKNQIKITLDGTNTWSNVNVSVKTADGKTVKAKLLKKTSNYCIIQTNKKLEKKTYVIKVKGVKIKGSSKYETITTKIKVN